MLPIIKKLAGIAVSVHKETTSKGIETNRNFGKWLSYGRGISGTLGSTSSVLVLTVQKSMLGIINSEKN